MKNGQALLDEEIANAKDGTLSGEVVFKLYDTYGFPFELTQEIAEEHGLKIVREQFDEQMQAQKDRARAARNAKDSFASQNEALMNFTTPSEFVGYDELTCEGKVIALFKEGEMVDAIEGEGDVIFDRTCFYAESGGQVADAGTVSGDGVLAEVVDVQKTRNAQNLVKVHVKEGVLRLGDLVHQSVDAAKRARTTANHSCTHLLQARLKKCWAITFSKPEALSARIICGLTSIILKS